MFPRNFKTFALGVALSGTLAGGVMAQTAPDTPIINTIDLTYSSGAGTAEVSQQNAASVEFRVDRKIDVVVIADAGDGRVTVVPGETAVTLPFLVENRGNDTQGFRISVNDTGSIGVAGGLEYSAGPTTDLGRFYVVISPDTTTTNAEASVYDLGAAGNAGNLTASGEYYVLIVANIPIGAADGQLDDFVVTARATTAGGNTPVVRVDDQGLMGVNTVFADTVSLSKRTGNEIDIALNGQAVDETRIEVTAPDLDAKKNVAVIGELTTFDCDNIDAAPAAGIVATAGAIPGACIEYTIEVTNNSTSGTTATSVTIADELPSQVLFQSVSTVSYDGGTGTTANQPALNADGRTVEVTIGTLPADVTATFRIRATIN